ncbi:protein translocase subunit SecD [Hamadaea tsunoensis]|uniref:protein translocase subunit SecD n=1 Tax=Hamadaea tsunoensis TaxID=53368 RepID=UPI000484D834|nr:protein translocase subunit SecD [Hamadaea tsunoensis]
MRPGRQLAVLAGLFVLLYLIVFLGGSGSWHNRLHPRLGLDLVGGLQMTLEAQGKAPSSTELEQARQIIEDRVNGYGVAEAEVVTESNKNIVISIPGNDSTNLNDVGQPAQMYFRKVLNVTQDYADALAAATASPSASTSAKPSASTSAKPSTSASAKPSTAASASPKASASTGGQGGGAAASASASPAPSASAAPSTSASPEPVLDPEDAAAQAKVKAKVGDAAWNAAMALTAPVDLSTDPSGAAPFANFAKLTPNEVAILPAKMQFNVPQIGCTALDKRPIGSINKADQQVVACDSGAKEMLDVAKVKGTDIGSAQAVAPNSQQPEWTVSLKFKGDGQDKWTNLTKESVNKTGATCETAALGGTKQNCRVAVVLDNQVISAPEILDVLSDNSSITGNFTSDTATDLANKLNYGALPITFKADQAVHVTATLGQAQLKAGLLAAGIGMLLVAVYAFFYYRLLGTVIFLSLILSGLLTFGMLVVLGRTMGFTLTLAGIAGFIVSLGVAADSFVIYFERLKDEIREGKTPRSAVPRAWVRARRTIITANTVSIMAAVVLFLFSAGAVKGFAFALGLATLIDLIVVFLFRHPIMAMFARTNAFLSPRVSGLGRVLHQQNEDDDEAAPGETRRYRAKEA